MTYAVSPFERNMNEAGGSLALAVIKYVVTLIVLAWLAAISQCCDMS